MELYFGIFTNYETVIENRLETKKKNILLREQEKLAQDYKNKYEKALNKITLFQKKINEVTFKHKKQDILYNNLKEKYSRLAHLLERVKSHNFDSLLKIAKEHTNYANLMTNRRRATSRQGRRMHRTYQSNFKISSKVISKDKISQSLVSETENEEYSKDISIDVDGEGDQNSIDRYSFLNHPLEYTLDPKRSFSHKDFHYNRLNFDEETTLIRTVASTISEIKPTAEVHVQTDDVELYKLSNNNYLYTFSQDKCLYPVEQRLMDKLDKQAQKGSRQNKIISLLMNNRQYNIRVQNMFHSDRLNSLIDSEYFLPIYYNTLYQKIDKLLANIEDDGYGSVSKDSESEKNEGESFSDDEEFTHSDDAETSANASSRKGIKGLQKTILKSLQKFKKGANNSSRK